jgi:hypothetical protein
MGNRKSKEMFTMTKMIIYETAMCCSTGLCGVGVDPELLRISTVISTLKKSGVEIERFNLTNSPNEFIVNSEVNRIILDSGVDSLPITLLDGKIVKTAAYPTNREIIAWLGVPENTLADESNPTKKLKLAQKPRSGCGDGNCC